MSRPYGGEPTRGVSPPPQELTGVSWSCGSAATAHLLSMALSIHTPDELIAALPHLLGFKPEDSLLFVPLGPDLPLGRADIPTNPRDRDGVWESLGTPFKRNVPPGARMAIVCISNDRDYADDLSIDFAERFSSLGIDTPIRLWANDTHFHDFTTGEAGTQTEAARARIAATTVLMGRPQPAPNRAALAASLVGNRQPISDLLQDARAHAAKATQRAEARWAGARLQQFHHDGNRLPDADAARLLVGITSLPVRDRLWDDITRSTLPSHLALWRDLTRRAPDELRAAPAGLLAFSSWLNGDGATAWCALDQVPANQHYALANHVAAALDQGLNPHTWEAASRRDLTPTSAFAPTGPSSQQGPAHEL